MRRLVLLLAVVAVTEVVASAAAVAAPPEVWKVRYIAVEEPSTWQPLAPGDVASVLEHAALEVLTRSGLLQLEPLGDSPVSAGVAVLRISGRTIDEAETHNVQISFDPGGRSDLPSLRAADSVVIGKLARAVMLERIEASARAAATQLQEALRLALQRTSAAPGKPPVALELQALPWRWPEVTVPAASSGSAGDLFGVDARRRDAALRELTSLALAQASPRHALEKCALTHADADVRRRCLEALRPLSSAEAIAQLLAKEGAVPNLELAVARCLQQDNLARGKKSACAQYLLGEIAPARRAAVAWRYLDSVAVFEQGGANVFEDVEKELSGHGKTIDAALAEKFLSIAERPGAGHIRQKALYVVGKHPQPSPALIERLVVLARDPLVAGAALRVAVDLVRKDAPLRAMTLGALKQLARE